MTERVVHIDRFRCGPPARWLPRVLAASVLLAGLSASERFARSGVAPGAGAVRLVLALAGGVAALWIVRRGAEVRLSFEAGPRGLRVLGARGPAGAARLDYERIASLRWEPPLGPSRRWISATVLHDLDGRAWRLPALLDGGQRLLEAIVRHSGRADLGAWIEAGSLGRRMARSRARVALGYAAAAGVAVAALVL